MALAYLTQKALEAHGVPHSEPLVPSKCKYIAIFCYVLANIVSF